VSLKMVFLVVPAITSLCLIYCNNAYHNVSYYAITQLNNKRVASAEVY